MSAERLQALLASVDQVDHLLILPHNDPDPDAVASAVGLRFLLSKMAGVESTLIYRGIIGRAENRALDSYLDHPFVPLENLSSDKTLLPVAMVDTQPGTGNNSIPAGSKLIIVFDHHPLREATTQVEFYDVRASLGATATIITEYLQAAQLEPNPQVATALFYGIKTDTMGLSRGASPADAGAYFYLQPLIDVDALIEIERSQVPVGYFKSFDTMLRAARIYDNRIIFSYIGIMAYPDLAAEMADMLLRLEGSEWVICIGAYQDGLVISVRTRNRQGGAGQLARSIVGDEGVAGGHGVMAGGHLPLHGRNPKSVAFRLRKRVLSYFNLSAKAKEDRLL